MLERDVRRAETKSFVIYKREIGTSGSESESHNFRSVGGRLNIQDDRRTGRM